MTADTEPRLSTLPWEPALVELQRLIAETDERARLLRGVRDDFMRDLGADGVTGYRMADVAGMSQTAVSKIIHA